MTLYFITGNVHKLDEINQILSPEVKIKQLDIDLDEIQSLKAEEVIKHKLLQAMEKHKGEFIVEDTSIYIDALNGFPGPLIKWFFKALGKNGIADIVLKIGKTTATVKTIIGYSDGKELLFFEGTIDGNIVAPRAESDFGFDPIFVPLGQDKTFAEMGTSEKNKISHRRKATLKFKEYYLSKNKK
jgi:non-canonical purine NTP pyrophosphatase (RdgB/HAM1 family)